MSRDTRHGIRPVVLEGLYPETSLDRARATIGAHKADGLKEGELRLLAGTVVTDLFVQGSIGDCHCQCHGHNPPLRLPESDACCAFSLRQAGRLYPGDRLLGVLAV